MCDVDGAAEAWDAQNRAQALRALLQTHQRANWQGRVGDLTARPCYDHDEVRNCRLPPPNSAASSQAALGVIDAQLSERIHLDNVNKCFNTVQLEINTLKAGTGDSVDSVARSWAHVRWPSGEAARLRAAPTRYGSAPTRLS